MDYVNRGGYGGEEVLMRDKTITGLREIVLYVLALNVRT